ncbi:MAG: GTP cyclohydrolase I [Acidobacteriota bacterium]|nr:GTP cyclohydrolase I [Acidobacteriota bacterium]
MRSIAPLIRELLEALGEDTSSRRLAQTPERVEETLRFLTNGYGVDTDPVREPAGESTTLRKPALRGRSRLRRRV